MKKIFIVDDDDLYRLILTRTIARMAPEVEVEQFEDGAAALDALQHIADNRGETPYLILLDINMPVMDGWQFLDSVLPLKHKLAGPLNIYVASTSLDERDRDRAFNMGLVKEYLYKPIPPAKLQQLLQ